MNGCHTPWVPSTMTADLTLPHRLAANFLAAVFAVWLGLVVFVVASYASAKGLPWASERVAEFMVDHMVPGRAE